MFPTVVFALAAGIVGLSFGTYSIYAARKRKLGLRVLAAVLLTGPIALLGTLDISTWVLAGYLIGAAASFVVCDSILDRVGPRSSETSSPEDPT